MDFYEVDPKLGFYGGGGISARFQNYPISFAFGGLPPDLPQWGTEYKKAPGAILHPQHVADGPYHVAAAGGQQHLAR